MTRRAVWTLWTTIACALTIATPARAQVQLQGLVGVTSAGETAPFYAAALGLRAGFIELDLEAGRLHNVVPKGILDAITELEREHGLPVRTAVSVPATYGLANLRVISPAGVFRPFASAGIGVARLEPRLDVTIDDISLGDIFGAADFGRQTKTMALVSAGVRLDFHAFNVEGGYRFFVIYSHFHPDTALNGDNVLVSVSSAYAAIAIGF